MKKILLLLAILVTSVAHASTTVDLQGTTFNVDTLKHYYIGPGVTQTILRLTTSGRSFRAYTLTMDRDNAKNVVPKVIIGRDSCNTAEQVSSMGTRHTDDTHQYLAGINGDFFIVSAFAGQHELGNSILGYPNVTCMIDRQLAAPDIIDKGSRENCLIVASDNWYIDATDLRYLLHNADGTQTVEATAVNYPRYDNALVVYNPYSGKYTKTKEGGREIALRLAPGSTWAINSPVKFVVEGTWHTGGCMAIPSDGIVISMGPSYETNSFLANLKEGDVVQYQIECSLPAFGGVRPDILETVGGDVRILKENEVTTSAIRFINTPTSLYSRSFAGYDRERRHMVLCSVDANARESGISYFEGADLMRFLGCWDALDLDGGGSTTMWSATHGIVNTLRDGSERAVGNGLFFMLNAPADKTVTSIRFADPTITLPKYGLYRPVIYGYNQYGQLVDTDVKGYTLEAGSDLGTITDVDGSQALLASGAGYHGLTAHLGDMQAAIAVTVDDSQPAAPASNNIVVDQYHSWPVRLIATVGDTQMDVAPQAYSWVSEDPTVATVDNLGKVTGVADGTTTITGTSPAGSVSVTVTTQCPKALHTSIDAPTIAPDTWTISKSAVSSASLSSLGNEGGMLVDFTVSSTRGARVALAKDITLWGIPDAVELSINPGNQAISKLSVSLKAASADRAVSVELGALNANETVVKTIPISQIAPDDDPATYPVEFVSLTLVPKSKATYSVSIDRLSAVYNNYNGIENVSVDNDNLVVVVSDSELRIATPAARLALYDMTGRLVATAVNATALPRPAHGFYILVADKRTARLAL